MAGETIELLVKTILEADPSQQLAAIEEINAAIKGLGESAAKVSSGKGGNYNTIVEQAASFEAHIKAGVSALRTAGISPALVAQLEKLQGQPTAVATGQINNPATREQVGARIETRASAKVAEAEAAYVASLTKDTVAHETTADAVKAEGVAAEASAEAITVKGKLGKDYTTSVGGQAITSKTDDGFYLRNISIPEAQRGQGAGTALVRQITKDADTAGVSLSLHTAQEGLIKWYESLGFVTQGTDELGTLMRRDAAAVAASTTATTESTQQTRRTTARKAEVERVGPDLLTHLGGQPDEEAARRAAAAEFYYRQASGSGGGDKPPRIIPQPAAEEPFEGETAEQKASRQRLRSAELRRVNNKEKQAQEEARVAGEGKAADEAALAAQKASDEAVKIERAKQVEAVRERARGNRPPGAPQQLSEPVLSAFSEKVVTAQEQAGVQEQLLQPESGYTEAVARVRLALQQQSALIEENLLTLTGVNEEEGAYALALARTRIAQARTNADVNIRLNAEREYAQSLAENKSAQRQVKARTEALLAADNEYIEATASLANSRRTIGALSKQQELAGVGFEKTSAGGIAYPDQGVGITSAERERRRAVGVQQITELEGATKATSEYRKLQTELAEATRRQLINAQAAAGQNEASLITQRKTIEAALNAELEKELAGSVEYQAAAKDLAVATKVRAAQEKASLEKQLAIEQDYILAKAEAANAQKLSAELIKQQQLQGVGLRPTLVGPSGERIAATAAAQEEDLAALRLLTGENLHNAELARARTVIEQTKLKYSEAEAEEIATAAFEERRYNEIKRQQINAAQRAAYNELKASGAPAEKVGTPFQQFLAKNSERGSGDFKDPLQQAQLGQFLKSKFLTTAGFAVSGVITYAAFSGIQKMVTDSTQLERILSQVRAQFEALGEGDATKGFIEGIKDISRQSGEAAADVANIAFQFKGAFDKKTNAVVLDEVQSAVEISRVTGLSLAEVTDSLTSTALDYGVSVRDIGDATIALQDRTGVLATHIITAIADLAPVAEEVGLKMEKIGAIAAVAQQRSGQSGAALAESLNRILPTIGQNAGDLIQFFRQNRPKNEADEVLKSLATGETGKVFDLIGTKYDKLTDSQQKYVQSLLGTKKDLKGLIPVFNNYGEVIDLTTKAEQSSGRLHQSYAALQETLSQQLQRVAAAFKNIGQAILSLGVSEAVQDLAKIIGVVVVAASDFVSIFASINDVLGGMPGKVAAVVVTYLALAKVLRTINELGFATTLNNAVVRLPGGKKLAGGAAGAAETTTVAESTVVSTVPFITSGGKLKQAEEEVTKSGNRVSNAVGGFGKNMADKSKDVEGRLASSKVRIGNALSNFAGAFEALLPLLAIFAAIEVITSGIKGFTETKSKLDDLRANATEEGGFQTEAGQKAIDKYFKERSKALDPGHSLNPFTEVKRAFGIAAASTTKDAEAVGADAVQSQTTKAFAQTLKASFSDKQLAGILQLSSPNALGSLSVDDIKRIAKKGTVDDAEFQKVIDAFTKSAEFKKGLGEAYQHRLDDGKKEADRVAELSASLDSLPTLLIKEDIGAITPREFQSKAKATLDGLTEALDIAIADKSDPELIKSLKSSRDATKQALDQSLTKYLNEQVSTKALATTLSGAGQKQTLQSTIRANAAALAVPNALTSSAAPQLAQASVEAQKALLQYMVDHAASNAEAARLLKDGFKIPESVANVLEISNLQALPDDTEQVLTHSAAALQKDFDAVLEEIVKAKGGLRAGIQKLIDELIDAYAKLARAGLGKGKRAQLILRHVADLRRLSASGAFDVGVDTGTIPGTESSTATQDADAQAAYNQAVTQDPLAKALLAQADAQRKLTLANRAGSPTNTKAGRIAALQAIQEANQQYEDAANGIASAKIDLLAAAAAGDPVAVAQANIAKANLAIQQAKGKGQAAELAAQAQLIQANKELEDAIQGIAQANFAVLTALADGDALAGAQIALAQANDQLAHAHGEAERLQALAAQINAQHAIRDAIFAIADAQSSLLIAIANAAGETVKAAQLALQHAKDVLARDLARGLNAQDPRVIQDRQSVVEQEAAVRDAALNDAVSDINFLLATHKISNQQAIARLKILDQNEKLTKQEHQQLEQQIYDLQHQSQQDLQFNLPSDIKLPTLYESRRFNESGGSAGGSNYQDNRKIDIKISTNAKLDGKDVEVIVSGITDAINQPPRYGNRARTY